MSLASMSFVALIAHRPLVLGSSSPTRAAILREMGLSFTVDKPGIDEKAIRHSDPRKLVSELGKAKAAALRGRYQQGGWLLTADQVVVCDGRILEKPVGEDEARQFISMYSRSPPMTVGSVVLTDATSGQQWSALDEATIHFDPIPEGTVDQLIAEGGVYHCAGGLMVEHPLISPYIVQIDGSIDSVMGLSKDSVMRLLREAGIETVP
jgi:septum formation protein